MSFELLIAKAIMEQPYMDIDKSFLVTLTPSTRLNIFRSFFECDNFAQFLDLKNVLCQNKQIDEIKLQEMTDWLNDQATSDFVITEWLMVGFKSDKDAALFKLFWL